MDSVIDFLKEEKKYTEKEMINFANFTKSDFSKRFFTGNRPKEVWDNDVSNWKGFTENGRKLIDFHKVKDL